MSSREEQANEYILEHGDAQTRVDFLAGWDAAMRAGVVAEEPEWEPSDAATEVVARALFARTKEGRDGWTWPIDQWRRERDMDAARSVLKRAHAAGVPVKQEGETHE